MAPCLKSRENSSTLSSHPASPRWIPSQRVRNSLLSMIRAPKRQSKSRSIQGRKRRVSAEKIAERGLVFLFF
jgi:hypothetical protein